MDSDEILIWALLATVAYIAWKMNELQKQNEASQQTASLSQQQLGERLGILEHWKEVGY
ncbi:hypothetical protein ACFLRF_04870 [Candidatus Altiarchaeota archaeon]